MIKIKGYWQFNGHKSEFTRCRKRLSAARLEELRTELEQQTGHQIMFYHKTRNNDKN
jgi:hypothetical protein